MDIAAVLEIGDRAYALAEIESDSSETEIRALLDLELWHRPVFSAEIRAEREVGTCEDCRVGTRGDSES